MAALMEAPDDDGTPKVINVPSNDFDSLYEHRRAAKDRSVTESLYFDRNPMNNSSFHNLLIGEGESQLLYSKSSERDKIALEEF